MEDRLQDQVARSIADFITAGIKFWMLTGDKLETAENIAYSCNLIQEEFTKLYLVEADDLGSAYDVLCSELSRLNGNKVALVAEGSALMRLLSDDA